MNKENRKLKQHAKYVTTEAKRILKKWRGKLDAEQIEPLAVALQNVNKAIEAGDIPLVKKALQELEHVIENDFAFARKSALRDWFESLFFALLIALFLRTFVLEAFKIPSASMVPTLVVGDHIFVNKFIYGIRLPLINKRIVEWGNPERGDVIVFVYPHDPDKDYIKRVIGLPGDHILVKDEEVLVNGEPVAQSDGEEFSYIDETTGIPRHVVKHDAQLGDANFTTIYEPDRYRPAMEYSVKEGHLFVMGDNRDNSADSRTWGLVPYDNIKGEAILVWWSSSEHAGVRFSRIGHLIE